MKAPVGPVLLLAVVLFFGLPFMEISCKDRSVATLTGYEVAFGKKFEAELPVGEWLMGDRAASRDGGWGFTLKDERRTEGNSRALGALAAAVLGGLVAFFWRPAGLLGGVAALVLLLVVRADVLREVGANEQALLAVTFQWGFWGALVCAVVGAVACLGGGKAAK